MNKELAPISQIRRNNVLYLMKQHEFSRKDLAEKLEMKDSLLSGYIGKNPSKGIGHQVASRLEVVFGLQKGELDKCLIKDPTLKAKQNIIAGTFLECPLFLGNKHNGLALDETLEVYMEKAYIRLSVIYDHQVGLDNVKAFKVVGSQRQEKFPEKSIVFIDTSVDSVLGDGYFLLSKNGLRTICYVKSIGIGYTLNCGGTCEDEGILENLDNILILGRVFHTEFSVN